MANEQKAVFEDCEHVGRLVIPWEHESNRILQAMREGLGSDSH